MSPHTDEARTHQPHLLEVRHLNLWFETRSGPVQILDDVNLTVAHGDTLGLIGESGSGKTMTGLSILGLVPTAARLEGEVLLDGVDLAGITPHELRNVRGRDVSMVFQEPMTALDPVFTIGHQISQVLRTHQPHLKRRAARSQVVDILDAVGIPDPRRRYDDFPHQMSGGMRQRVLIAMALICEPKLLIADEPTTAVDVTIQAQLLELMKKLAIERSTSMIFISHDIGVIAEMCSRVAVMYAGQIVEVAEVDDLLENPRHPYASGLLWAAPRAESRGSALTPIPGRVPSPHEYPSGCRFEARCAFTEPGCAQNQQLVSVGGPTLNHDVRCIRAGELNLPGVLDQGLLATEGPSCR